MTDREMDKILDEVFRKVFGGEYHNGEDKSWDPEPQEEAV